MILKLRLLDFRLVTGLKADMLKFVKMFVTKKDAFIILFRHLVLS